MPISKSCKIRVGITMGDPSGIGPAIIAKAWPLLRGKAEFVIIGDKWVYGRAKELCRIKPSLENYRFVDLENILRRKFSFGKVKAEYGRASLEYLDKAMELIRAKQIDCLVTGPISKFALRLAGFSWPGHTEYLASRAKTSDFAMLLLNASLKVSLVTRHIPLKDVASELKPNQISKTISLTCDSLKKLFRIKKPRIVVCGLNPHASDSGVIGKEEDALIRPALNRARARNACIAGPLPADVAFLKALKKEYDAVVAMYHDQALIALKTTGYDSGANLTLGLPFVRTSPLHGTAFDIAAKAAANPASFLESVNLAIRCASNLKRA